MSNQTTHTEDPSIQFDSPKAVFDHAKLSLQDKISILQDWEYQVRQELVANEESFNTTASVSLHDILDLLHKLGADSVVEQGSHGNKMG